MNGALRRSASLLWSRTFGTFWFASLLSNIGTWAQQVAEPWLLVTLGASPFVLGLDTFAMNAPVWLLTLLGGVLADRSDRRRVITLFQSAQMLCPAAIVVLLVTGLVRPWMIIALSVIVGVTDALSMPSFQSIVPSIVPRAEIGNALALNSIQFSVSRVLGPSIAGVLMAGVGMTACFALSAASYIPFIGVALWILPRRGPAPEDRPLDGRSFTPAARAVLASPATRRTLLGVLATAVLCAPLITFCPLLAREVFAGNAARFSVMAAAFGLGGLLGGGALLAIPPEIDRRRLGAAFALTFAAALVLIAVAPWFWPMVALLVLAGAAMTVTNTSANTHLQATADPRHLGQTVSLYMLAMRGGVALGALITGLSVGLLGVQRALLVNGLVAVVAQLAIWAGPDVGESPSQRSAIH